jgi:copper transport protein
MGHLPLARSRFGPARLGTLTAILLLSLIFAPRAAAHARLAQSDPPAGAVLPQAPPMVKLTMSESISPQFSRIQVLDRARHDVTAGPVAVDLRDPATIGVVLQPGLPSGVYTVLWRAISAVDGHVTLGNFAFTIQAPGEAVAPAAPAPASDAGSAPDDGSSPPPPVWRWIWRALVLIGAAGLLGGPLFSSLILAGAPAEDLQPLAPALGRRLARLVLVSAVVVLGGLLADMLYELAAVRGTDVPAALGNVAQVGDIITTTGYGAFWAVKVVAVVALLGYALWRGGTPTRPEWTAAVMNGGFLLAGEALGSHGAAARGLGGLPLGMLSDLLHLLAAAAWVGGLIYLAVVALPVVRRAEPGVAGRVLARLVPRFSTLSLVSIGVLVVTGLLNLAIHTLDPAAIVESDYGRVLLVKHLLFLPLAALAALNHGIVRPRLVALLAPGARETAPLTRGLGRTVGTQVALAVAVMICAAGLTLLPPPVSAGGSAPGSVPAPAAPPSGPPAPTPTPVIASASQTVSGIGFDLTTAPGVEGDHFTVAVTRSDLAGPPLTDVLKLQLRVTPQDVDAGSTSLEVHRVGAAEPDRQVYTATGQIFTLSGAYQLTAELLRTQGADVRAGFRLVLADDGTLAITPSEVLQALVTTNPSPAISGTVQLNIKIVDGQEQPVPGATLRVTPLMPSHGHVEPTGDAVPVAGQPGVYRLPANLPMGGPWLVLVEVDRPGQPPVKLDGTFSVIDPLATATPAPP